MSKKDVLRIPDYLEHTQPHYRPRGSVVQWSSNQSRAALFTLPRHLWILIQYGLMIVSTLIGYSILDFFPTIKKARLNMKSPTTQEIVEVISTEAAAKIECLDQTCPPTPLNFSTKAAIFWNTLCFLVRYCGLSGLILGRMALSSVPFSLANSRFSELVM